MVSNKAEDKKPNTNTKNNISKSSSSKPPQKPKQQKDENKTLKQIAKQKQNKEEGNSKVKESKKREKGESGGGGDGGKEDEEMCKFAFSRVKRVAKSEIPDMKITNDAVFLINKAAEKFLQTFAEAAYVSAVEDRKKSISYKHLSNVVHNEKRYEFLSDFVPEMVKAEDALAEWKKMKDTLKNKYC